MVEERITLNELAEVLADDAQLYLPGCEPPGPETIHTELPPGLIDLPSASRKYGIREGTLRQWVHVGKLPRRGRLRGPAAGGGFVVTEEALIPYCRDNPRKPGPKPKQKPS